jgi:copper chaperone CopZ
MENIELRIGNPDQCDDCLDTFIAGLPGVQSVKLDKDIVDIRYDKDVINPGSIIGELKEVGYHVKYDVPSERKLREALHDPDYCCECV